MVLRSIESVVRLAEFAGNTPRPKAPVIPGAVLLRGSQARRHAFRA